MQQPSPRWVDKHSHLDTSEFKENGLLAVVFIAQRAIENVVLSVIPALERSNFDTLRQRARAQSQACGLGIHPLYVPQAKETDLAALDAQITQHLNDPHLIAVGEIRLDFFRTSALLARDAR